MSAVREQPRSEASSCSHNEVIIAHFNDKSSHSNMNRRENHLWEKSESENKSSKIPHRDEDRDSKEPQSRVEALQLKTIKSALCN